MQSADNHPVYRTIEWDGEPFALLIESATGSYLVPPIMLNEHDTLIEGRDVLLAIVEAGINPDHPVVRAPTPAALAEIDQRMAALSEQLRVPIGPQRACT